MVHTRRARTVAKKLLAYATHSQHETSDEHFAVDKSLGDKVMDENFDDHRVSEHGTSAGALSRPPASCPICITEDVHLCLFLLPVELPDRSRLRL